MCMLIAQALQAQHPAYWQYTTNDGLPSNTIHDMQLDRDGYMWFSTDRGISRYDGYAFQTYRPADAQLDNEVFEIFEDHHHKLWFVHRSSMLSYLQDGKITAYEHNDILESYIDSRSIMQDFYVDSAGTVFYSFTNSPTLVISSDGKAELLDTANHGCGASIHQMPGAQALFYIRHTTRPENCYLGLGVDTVFERFRHIRRNFSHRLGTDDWLFTSNSDHMLRLVDGSLRDYGTFPEGVHALYADSSYGWVGTSLGLVRIPLSVSGNHRRPTTTLLEDRFISSITGDADGGIWVATLFDGVFYIPNHEVFCFNKGSGMTFDHVTAIGLDYRGRIYAGGKDGRVDVLDSNGLVAEFMDYDVLGVVTDFACDEDGSMVFVASGTFPYRIKDLHAPVQIGLRKKQCGTLKWLHPHPEGGFLLAGNDAFCRLAQNQLWRYLKDTLEEVRTTCVHILGDTLLYIGTVHGLQTFHLKDHTWEDLADEQPLLGTAISAMAEVSSNLLAVATRGSGLLLLRNREIDVISSRQGLLSDDINDLKVEGSHIWVGSERGLNEVMLMRAEGMELTVRSYDASDGLLTSYVNQLEIKDGKVYVASHNGLSVFDPGCVSPVTLPRLHLDKVSVNGVERSVGGLATSLSPNENRLKFEFTGVHFRRVQAIEYRYRLVGLDNDWVTTSSRQVEFSSLAPGDYTFEWGARVRGGDWATHDNPLRFSISAPIWTRWWFITSTLILVLLVIRWRMHVVRKKTVALERIKRQGIESELKAIRAQMNPHFVFNSLNAIKHYLLTNDTVASDRFISEFSRFLRMILDHSSKSYVPLRAEIDMLECYLALEKTRFESRFDYHIEIKNIPEGPSVEIPPMLIYPYVESAVLYGMTAKEGGGHIEITFRMEGEQIVHCCIEHNGASEPVESRNGYDPMSKQSLGMLIAKERLESENPELSKELKTEVTKLQEGQRVDIHIPCRSDT